MFGKKKNEPVITAAKKIITELLTDNDDRAVDLVNELKDGHPLLINFDDLDRIQLNKMLAFFTGAAVALDGDVIQLKKKDHNIYLFVRKVDELDGSVKEYLKKYEDKEY